MQDREARFQPEQEREKIARLETIVYFIRHGKAEKLPGADTKPEIDAKRRHTPEGKTQVQHAGELIAEDINLGPGDLVFYRSSHTARGEDTARQVREVFLERQEGKGATGFFAPEAKATKRKAALFPEESGLGAYEVGGKRRGSTSGLSEEWTRNPKQFQADMEEAGLSGKQAEQILADQKDQFQNTMAVADRASRVFAARWSKADVPKDAHPPKVVLLVGSHGFVSEPWLKEVVADYERERGQQIRLELGYGEYWKMHIPSNPEESATVTIGGHTIPVKEEFLRRIVQE